MTASPYEWMSWNSRKQNKEEGVHRLYAEDGAVRLVDGSGSHEGRVEIFHNSEWGTVCDDSWGVNDANVVCRQLGYESALSAEISAYFGRGRDNQAIFLDDVDCDGDEEELSECESDGWGNNNCHHGEDAGVICRHDAEEGELRIVEGTKSSKGVLEIYNGTSWGNICFDGWTLNNSKVACRQLRYQEVDGAHRYTFGYIGSGPFYLWNVGCSGNEDELSDCANVVWGDYSHCSYEVGIACSYTEFESTTVQPTTTTMPTTISNGKQAITCNRL
ncbi:scavenger receptor cysteine-rich domain-containing group B protein-like [Diadema antillarum]|uniref:scavenger receptor cysteine-rich domain-containing group B protein-like n=1 Tax=Diadema antillarum TaxID=105358 RepID=UPI003A85A3DA